MELGSDQFALERRYGRVLVTLIGEFDDFNVDELEGSLNAALDGSADAVELDTTKVTYLSSTALRALIAFHDAAAARQVTVTIPRASYVVRRLLEVVGLSSMFGMSSRDGG